jgi:TPR repeat protein
MLAEALEKGEGVTPDRAASIALYRAAALQNREPEAKKRAEEALARLAAAAPAPAQGKR